MAQKRPRFPAPPIDIDPRVVRGDHSSLEAARQAYGRLHSGWKILAEASDRITDPDKLAREARAHLERTTRSLRADNDRMWAAYRHLRDKIHAAVAPGPRDPIGAEIRTWLRSQSDPSAEVRKAIDAGDRQIVSALLSGPHQLSGIDRKQLDTLHEHAMRTFEFEDWAAMETMSALATKHGNYVERFENDAAKHISAWATGDDAAIKELFGDKT